MTYSHSLTCTSEVSGDPVAAIAITPCHLRSRCLKTNVSVRPTQGWYAADIRYGVLVGLGKLGR